MRPLFFSILLIRGRKCKKEVTKTSLPKPPVSYQIVWWTSMSKISLWGALTYALRRAHVSRPCSVPRELGPFRAHELEGQEMNSDIKTWNVHHVNYCRSLCCSKSEFVFFPFSWLWSCGIMAAIFRRACRKCFSLTVAPELKVKLSNHCSAITRAICGTELCPIAILMWISYELPNSDST